MDRVIIEIVPRGDEAHAPPNIDLKKGLADGEETPAVVGDGQVSASLDIFLALGTPPLNISLSFIVPLDVELVLELEFAIDPVVSSEGKADDVAVLPLPELELATESWRVWRETLLTDRTSTGILNPVVGLAMVNDAYVDFG